MYQPQPINLPGGFYGPPIPSQPYSAAQPSSRSRACFRLAIRIFIAVCTVLIITFVIIWFIFRPHRIEVSVDGAALSRFSLTAPDLLSYHLSTNFSIRNPNSRIGLYYDSIEATAYYDDFRFGNDMLTSFYQGNKNTTVLRSVMEGNSMSLRSGVDKFKSDKFKSENRTGAFSVDVCLSGRVRYKSGSVTTTRRYRMKVKCQLRVPLVSNGTVTGGATFQRTDCYVARI